MKKVLLPVSKSLYIRKLIYDFLYSNSLEAIPSDASGDIRVVHHCLTCISQNAGGGVEQDGFILIDVRDCGAAYRFMMAVLAVIPGHWLLTGTPRLMQRPIEELVQSLRSIGAEIQWCSCRDVPRRVSTNDMVIPNETGAFSVSNVDGVISCRDAMHCVSTNAEYNVCWQIRGKNLHASELTIDCTRSGQFASALLLISKKIGLQKLHILPENPSSSAYIAMTKSIMAGEADLNPLHLGDWSAAVYWYAFFLLSRQKADVQQAESIVPNDSPVSISEIVPDTYKLLHLDLHSIQSDAVLARWFSDWGIESRQEDDGVLISYNERLIKLQEVIELDMSQNLDLVPVMACMACLWPKKMVFNGVANLKYKESDRLKIIQEELSEFAEIQLNAYNGIDDNQLVVNSICRDVPWRVSTNNMVRPNETGAFSVSNVDGVISCRDAMHCVSTNNKVISHGDVPWRVSTNNAISCRDAMHCVSTNENGSNNAPIIFSFDAHNDHRFVMGFSLFALKGKVQIKGFDCVRKSYPDFKAEGVVAGPDIIG